jgi:hypothetical protein
MSLALALTIDVEDVFHGPEVGNDDIILEVVRLLDEAGIPASFFFIGRRAELLADRGRSDITRAVSRAHAVGTHGLSPDHPTIPEICAASSWEEGVREVREREQTAWEIVERVFGVEPCGLSQHFFYGAPQVHAVAAEIAKPYVYGLPAAPPFYGPTWFCGSLNIPAETGRCWDYIPETEYADPMRFQIAADRLWERFDDAIATQRKMFSVTLCHPLMLRCVDWPEHVTHANGRNMPREKWPQQLARIRRRSDAEVAAVLTNMKALLERIARDPRLDPVTVNDVHRRFGRQAEEIDARTISAVSEAQVAQDEILLDERLSPAELCIALCASIVAQEETGHLPRVVRREPILGPALNPALTPDVNVISSHAFDQGVRGFLAESRAQGRLLPNLGSVGIPAGLGSFYRALTEVYAARSKGEALEEVRLRPFNRYPAAAEEIGHHYLDITEEITGDSVSPGRLLDPETDTGSLCRTARLQTWTLRPAIAY